MEIPSIKMLDTNLKLLDEIDVYTSLDFVRSWQGVGSFNLVICGHEKSLETGNIIMLGNNGHKCGIIRTVNPNDNEKGTSVTVSGQTLNGITFQRIVKPYENADYFVVPRPTISPAIVSAEDILKTYISYTLGDISQSGSFQYGKQWDLGDLVTVASRKFNLTQNLRVTEVKESYEPKDFQLNVTLGTLPKRLGNVLKNLKSPVK